MLFPLFKIHFSIAQRKNRVQGCPVGDNAVSVVRNSAQSCLPAAACVSLALPRTNNKPNLTHSSVEALEPMRFSLVKRIIALVPNQASACGAIKGAIDNVELGNLTGLLDKIKPAISATTYSGERSSKNDAFVDAVAKTNVQQTINEIRKGSEVLSSLEKAGKLKIVGAMYHLNGGKVEFEESVI